MANDIPLEELMELWRSFFQDSRNRPVDKFGKEASAPKCTMCKGSGLKEDTLCPKCKGERVDSESIPTYSDEIQKVSREYPDGERSVSVTWEAVADFNGRLSSNLRWNLDETLDSAKYVVQEFIDEDTKERVRAVSYTHLTLPTKA